MVKIEFNSEIEKLEISLFGSKDDPTVFSEEVDSCRDLGLTYNPSKKVWVAPIGKLNSIIDELKKYEIELSEYDRMLINKKIDSLHELKQNLSRKERLLFVPSLMKFPPK